MIPIKANVVRATPVRQTKLNPILCRSPLKKALQFALSKVIPVHTGRASDFDHMTLQ